MGRSPFLLKAISSFSSQDLTPFGAPSIPTVLRGSQIPHPRKPAYPCHSRESFAFDEFVLPSSSSPNLFSASFPLDTRRSWLNCELRFTSKLNGGCTLFPDSCVGLSPAARLFPFLLIVARGVKHDRDRDLASIPVRETFLGFLSRELSPPFSPDALSFQLSMDPFSPFGSWFRT